MTPDKPNKVETRALSRSRQFASGAERALFLRFPLISLAQLAARVGGLAQKSWLPAETDFAAAPAGQRGRFSSWRGFVVFVVLPIVAGIGSFGFVTSDQFVSEVRFAVRGTTQPLQGTDALYLLHMGELIAADSSQEVYIVANYIRSRPMIDAISKKVDLHHIFSKPGIDWWSRLEPSGTPEDLLRYWQSMVTTSVDLASGVITVTVQTFSREDSIRLAGAIRDQCEAIADRLLDGVRNDAVERAQSELADARAQLLARKAAVEQFRHARMQIDPMASAHSLGDTISTLRQDLVNTQIQLDSAKASVEADAPQIKILAANRQILADQIAALEARITNADLRSPASSILLAEYDRLDAEKSLAQQTVELAEKEFEGAYVNAQRHHIYLVTFQNPSVPQKTLISERIDPILIISLTALSLWLLATLTAAHLRDHAV